MVAAVAQLEAGVEWPAVARRCAESPAQLEALLLVPAAASHPRPESDGYERSLSALWQLMRRLNEERELPPS